MKYKSSKVSIEPVETIMPFRVTWKDINVRAEQGMFKTRTKHILKDVSGYFESGHILAIMGPSGCGKSTLLGCISRSRKKGLTGSITISTNMTVKFGFIVQENYILERLSIKESLLFASKLKNDSKADHNLIVKEIIETLGLENCANNRPDNCSGGQLKRVLIGIEMVAKPNILILDEPTTGLDSVTTRQLIQTLIELTQQSEPVAVVLTIHQPSAKLFNLFDKIYLLSEKGECIYFGGPLAIIKQFEEFGLNCSKFTNPSDFALEVATGEHGQLILFGLSLNQKLSSMKLLKEINEINVKDDHRFLNQIYYLTIRSLMTMIRDPFTLPLRFSGYIICSLLLSILYGLDSGKLSGCAVDFSIQSGGNLIDRYKEVTSDVFENYAGLTFTCLFGWFAGIFPVLLMFPMELNVFLKEYRNGCYTVLSYFLSKVLSDIPFNLVLPNLGSLIIYYLTGQCIDPLWRYFNFIYIFLLISFNSSALGFLIGAFLAEHPPAIAFLGMLSVVPIITLSGIMIRISSMPWIFQWLTYFNYMRFGITSVIINSYGFNRCTETLNNNQTNWFDNLSNEQILQIYSADSFDIDVLASAIESLIGVPKSFGTDGDHRSVVLKYYNLYDYDYNSSILMLFLHIIVLRFLTYLLIMKKIDLIN